MTRKPFTWFDLTRLLEDSTYVNQLASELRYSDTSKLSEVLKDCTDILLARREGVKDYKNKRTLHFNQNVLSDLPRQTGKIKKLCKSNMIEWWVKSQCFELYLVEFQFAIDQLDLLALLTLNYLDEAFAVMGNCDPTIPDSDQNLNKAFKYWEILQQRKPQWLESKRKGEVFLKLYKTESKHKQAVAGLWSAAENRVKAVGDDLRITFILLHLLNHETNKKSSWRSLNELVEDALNDVNEGLAYVPLQAQSAELNIVSLLRLKSVIKEINHFDSEMLAPFIDRPIPSIKTENSRWRHYKIVKKWHDDLQFTYLDREDK